MGKELGASNQKLDGLFILNQKYWADKHKSSVIAPAMAHNHGLHMKVATHTVPELHDWLMKQVKTWFANIYRKG